MVRRSKEQLFLDLIKKVTEFDAEKLEKATLEEALATLTECCKNLKVVIDDAEYLKELAALKAKYNKK